MSSTYSTSLGIELMGTGDQSGTWGTTTNTNLGTLLEQAITGVLSVAQGDTTLTLTATQGASNQARNAVINLTGAMTAGRNVVVPSVNKLYLFKNSTTGGFSTTIKTAAGSGVAVLNGQSRLVYCDGTDVIDGLSLGTIATQTASNVAITGGTVTGLTSLTLASGVASPGTNDAAALGTTSLMWSDLFLASGGVINWNNGDVTITHAAATLTVAGATTINLGTSTALTAGTIELGAASDTTISRSAAGVIAVEGVPLYSNIPQNSKSAAYTTVLADAQKHIYHPGADTTARVWTIDSNANVPYPIGTAITFINDTSAGVITISITSDTLVLAGPGTTGSRTLAASGIATAIKMTTTRWMISGAGLT